MQNKLARILDSAITEGIEAIQKYDIRNEAILRTIELYKSGYLRKVDHIYLSDTELKNIFVQHATLELMLGELFSALFPQSNVFNKIQMIMWYIPMRENQRFDFLLRAVTSQDLNLLPYRASIRETLNNGYIDQVISTDEHSQLIYALESNAQRMSNFGN